MDKARLKKGPLYIMELPMKGGYKPEYAVLRVLDLDRIWRWDNSDLRVASELKRPQTGAGYLGIRSAVRWREGAPLTPQMTKILEQSVQAMRDFDQEVPPSMTVIPEQEKPGPGLTELAELAVFTPGRVLHPFISVSAIADPLADRLKRLGVVHQRNEAGEFILSRQAMSRLVAQLPPAQD
jgi:hypothetical protein